MLIRKLGLATTVFAFVMSLTLSSFAGREVVSGSVDKVDAMKGHIVLKTQAGPREFTSRHPEKLKDIKPGDQVNLTIQEDGELVIEKAEAKK